MACTSDDESIVKEELVPVNEHYNRLNPQNFVQIQLEKMNNINGHVIKTFLDIIVLVSLHDSPKHGYKIIAEIHKQFGVMLSPGTLYPMLYGLEKEGWIEVSDVNRKKVYSLTPKGADSLRFLSAFYVKLFEKLEGWIIREKL